jgi:tetratricopeptide (TPR) repeat protein
MFRSDLRVSAVLALSLTLAAPAFAASGKTEEGVRLFETRQLAQARPVLEAAVREDPSDARAVFYLGRTLLSADEVDKAVEWIEKAVALDGGRVEYHLWLGRAYGSKAMRANVFQQASLAGKVRREFERASALDPDNLEARFGLVEFYLRAPGVMGGSVAKARDQAAEIARRDTLQGHRAAGRVAEHEKQFDAAREEFSAALREAPEKPEPYYWLGSFYERRKDYARAFETYEKQLMISNVDELSLAWTHYRLGVLYEKTQARELARAEYTAALSLDPTLKDAKKALSSLR